MALLLWELSTIFVYLKCVFHFSLMCIDVVIDKCVVPSEWSESRREGVSGGFCGS